MEQSGSDKRFRTIPLTDWKIGSLKPEDKQRRYTNGGNLFVEFGQCGYKHWRFAYTFDGKQRS